MAVCVGLCEWCVGFCAGYNCYFFFNVTRTPEIYTLSLHAALSISRYFVCVCVCGSECVHTSEYVYLYVCVCVCVRVRVCAHMQDARFIFNGSCCPKVGVS